MTQAEVNAILDSHEKWLKNKRDGKRADFTNQDLQGVNLSYQRLNYVFFDGANLENAEFCHSNLESCSFNRCKMRFANFFASIITNCDFYESDLERADFSNSILRFLDLRHANLRRAYFTHAIFLGGKFFNANLNGASIYDAVMYDCSFGRADFEGARLNGTKIFSSDLFLAKNIPEFEDTSIVPECGSFIGWKRIGRFIIKLEIPEDAKRCNATGRKCRCSHAKVLEIQTISGEKSSKASIESEKYAPIVYTVGETVYPDSFNENRWAECTNGIHFFITRKEAVDYC